MFLIAGDKSNLISGSCWEWRVEECTVDVVNFGKFVDVLQKHCRLHNVIKSQSRSCDRKYKDLKYSRHYTVIYENQQQQIQLTFENLPHIGEGLFGLAFHVSSDKLHSFRVHAQLSGNVHSVPGNDGLNIDKNKVRLDQRVFLTITIIH